LAYKFILHKRYWQPALFFGLLTDYSIYSLINEGISVFAVFSLLVFGFLTIASLFLLWKFRKTSKEDIEKTAQRKLPVNFSANKIYFPNGYYFRQSRINKDKLIEAAQINEINLNTMPPSFVIDHSEVIFVAYEYKEQLKDFGERNNIVIAKRFDIWEAIMEPFLDTEIGDEAKIKTLKLLEENGVAPGETAAIRKRIRFLMESFNYYAWEWCYMGQYDYLTQAFKTKKNYWWSMEIALRNYRHKPFLTCPNEDRDGL
jgi:hypothetical protein